MPFMFYFVGILFILWHHHIGSHWRISNYPYVGFCVPSQIVMLALSFEIGSCSPYLTRLAARLLMELLSNKIFRDPNLRALVGLSPHRVELQF
jgi:hypothetical protein